MQLTCDSQLVGGIPRQPAGPLSQPQRQGGRALLGVVESKALRSSRCRQPALEDGDAQPDGDPAFLPPAGHRVCKRGHGKEGNGRRRAENPLALAPSGFKPARGRQLGLMCESRYFHLIYPKVKWPSAQAARRQRQGERRHRQLRILRGAIRCFT